MSIIGADKKAYFIQVAEAIQKVILDRVFYIYYPL